MLSITQTQHPVPVIRSRQEEHHPGTDLLRLFRKLAGEWVREVGIMDLGLEIERGPGSGRGSGSELQSGTAHGHLQRFGCEGHPARDARRI
jgi:hypothetical protein